MKRKEKVSVRATEKELSMLEELAEDLNTTVNDAVLDAVRFAYLHVDLIVAWKASITQRRVKCPKKP